MWSQAVQQRRMGQCCFAGQAAQPVCLYTVCRDRLKEMQGIKKKTKAGQQRAEDKVEQGRTRPRGTRPLGMQKSPLSAGVDD